MIIAQTTRKTNRMKNNRAIIKTIIKYFIVYIGTLIYSASAVFFINPHDLAPGGVTGISIILNRIWDLPIGFYVLIINVPLLVLGLCKFGKEFLLGTVFGTLSLSLNIYLCEVLRGYLLSIGATWMVVENVILSCISGGCLMAVGIGLVFRKGCTTGGIDIIVKLLRSKLRHIKTGMLFLMLDIVIVLCSLPVVNWNIETILYAILAIFVTNFVFDFVLYGTDGAKLVYIVSDNRDRISKRIIKELDISATFINGVGAYSGQEKKVIMCVIKKQLFPKLKDVVAEEDDRAFFIVSSATEIFGEGYKMSMRKED